MSSTATQSGGGGTEPDVLEKDICMRVYMLRGLEVAQVRTIGVDDVGGEALGLQPHDVLRAVGEPLDLLEQRRAVAGPHARSVPAVIVREEMGVVHHQPVRLGLRVRLVALGRTEQDDSKSSGWKMQATPLPPPHSPACRPIGARLWRLP